MSKQDARIKRGREADAEFERILAEAEARVRKAFGITPDNRPVEDSAPTGPPADRE